MTDIKPISELDFFQIKDSLKTFLREQDRFKDFDFEGSNLNVLLDLLAYNTFYTQFYNNMAISEMFLDSAQLRNSVISHAKELNYLPRSKRSSRVLATVRITSNQASNTFNIPKHFKINARCGNQTFTYLTDKAYIADRVSGNIFEVQDVMLYEGRLVRETLDYSDTLISNGDIDTTSLEVYVNDVQYRYASDIFGVSSTDQVFYLQPEDDSKYSVQFGQNVFGYQPTSNDKIQIVYRICKGTEANGITSFTASNNNYGDASSIVIIPEGSAVGGEDAETMDRIRKFAPKSIQVQERAVTRSDYEILLRQRFPEIEAISVYGGDEAYPPMYGRAMISVDVKGAQGAGQSQIDQYREYIKDKSPLAIEPVFVPAQFLYVDVDAKVIYSSKVTAKSATQIRGIAEAAILDFFNSNSLNDFNSKLRQSRLVAHVDASDDAIISTDIVSKPFMLYEPALGKVENPYFDFSNQIVKPYPFNENVGFNSFNPSITSTVFTIDGTSVTLMDDGNGNINAVTAGATQAIFKSKIGTVDYANGTFTLSSVVIESYEGIGIRIYANTVDKDIYSRRDKVLSLQQEDITVRVVAE